MRLVLHTFLAFAVLASSMGFTVYERLCNMRGHQVTLSADHDKCCAHHAPKPSAKPKHACCKPTKKKTEPVQLDKGRCCAHKAIFLQAHAGGPLSYSKVKVAAPLPLLGPAPSLTFLPLVPAPVGQHLAFDPPDPPGGRELRIQHQSFRC